MEHIGVFLSSKEQVSDELKQTIIEFGRWIGQERKTLVYGGSRCGMMEELARAVKGNGGRVFGIVPQSIMDRDLASEMVDVEFRCADLTDRKAIMMRESDVFVALPGGIGTLDELFTVLAAHTFKMHSKPIILYNIHDFWSPLLDMLSRIEQESMVSKETLDTLQVVQSLDELENLLRD